MHENTALSLRNLRDDLSLLGIEDRVREYNKMINRQKSIDNNNDDDDDNDNDNDNSTSYTFEDLRTRFLQCQFGCQSAVPLKINDAFDSIDSSLMILLTEKNIKMLCHIYSTTLGCEDANSMIQDTIYFRAYDILTTNIVDSQFWPFIIPRTESLIEKTLNRLKLDVMGANTFWDDNSHNGSNAHKM